MTLLELHLDVARIANALDKIVFLLEKLALDPPEREIKVQQASLDDLHIISPEEAQRMADEAGRFAEIHRVVPGSRAFAEELIAWEDQQKEIHGSEWQAPDWASVFASAYRTAPSADPRK
jgi:hypothetical protein